MIDRIIIDLGGLHASFAAYNALDYVIFCSDNDSQRSAITSALSRGKLGAAFKRRVDLFKKSHARRHINEQQQLDFKEERAPGRRHAAMNDANRRKLSCKVVFRR
jgi:hypothetical protein